LPLYRCGHDHDSFRHASLLPFRLGPMKSVAVTLSQAPQHYESRFFEREIKGYIVSIVDEWCCGYVKGVALDPAGWQPLIETQPDWFEVIHLSFPKIDWMMPSR
jgi:hypothetical protein